MMFTSCLDSRLGNLGWHTQFTPKGIPLDNSTFRNYGKVCSRSDQLISLIDGFL